MSESTVISQKEFGEMLLFRPGIKKMKEAILKGFDLHQFEKDQKISVIAQLMLRNPERDFFYREIPFFAEHGASLGGLPDTIGENPMSVAVSLGNQEYVEFFLENGTNINRQRPYWGGYLNDAVRYGHPELVPFLLTQGADPTLTPSDGKSFFEYLKTRIKEAVKQDKPTEEKLYFQLYRKTQNFVRKKKSKGFRRYRDLNKLLHLGRRR